MERYFISYVNREDETCGDRTPCYSTIREAIDAANSGATIKVAEGSYDEALSPSSSKDLTLQGGWNSTFTTQSSTTTVKSLTIGNGSISVDNLVIQ
jgi:pectin methylesterase-like acyl-CoA thioesterase